MSATKKVWESRGSVALTKDRPDYRMLFASLVSFVCNAVNARISSSPSPPRLCSPIGPSSGLQCHHLSRVTTPYAKIACICHCLTGSLGSKMQFCHHMGHGHPMIGNLEQGDIPRPLASLLWNDTRSAWQAADVAFTRDGFI